MVKALIFDFDGLLVDSEAVWHRVVREMYALHGHTLSDERWLRGVGASLDVYDPFAELAQLVAHPTGPSRAERDAFEQEGERGFRASMRHTPLLPGVRELFAQAGEGGLRCAVASSSRRESVVPYLRRCGLLEALDIVVTCEDVDRVKPALDLYLKALAGLGLEPHEAVAFEDSSPGQQMIVTFPRSASSARRERLPSEIMAPATTSPAAAQMSDTHLTDDHHKIASSRQVNRSERGRLK